MTPAFSPLPDRFQRAAFTVADGLAAGLTRRALEHPRFAHPFHRARSLAADTPASNFPEVRTRRLCAAYAPLLRPHESFSHSTALLLYGIPLVVAPEVHVTAPLPIRAARAKGVHGHNIDRLVEPWFTHDHLPCVPPLVALLQSAPMLPFRELVTAIDALVLPRGPRAHARPLLATSTLLLAVEQAGGRGIRRLRAACEVARIGAESRMESLLHFELARDGLDTLELQGELHTAGGAFIGRFDEVDRERRKILEYDGDQHRTDRGQYLTDIERWDSAQREGYGLLRLQREHFRRAALPETRRRVHAFLQVRPQRIPARLAPYFAEPYFRAPESSS